MQYNNVIQIKRYSIENCITDMHSSNAKTNTILSKMHYTFVLQNFSKYSSTNFKNLDPS